MGCCSNESNCNCSCHSQGHPCCCPCHTKHAECFDEHECSAEAKANYFLEIADEAWEEVLKEKIKEYLLKNQNDHMNKLAKIVAEGNNHRWRNRMEKKQGCMEFQEELCQFFSQAKK